MEWAQLPIVEPIPQTLISASFKASTARLNASSGISCMLPFLWFPTLRKRASIYSHPRALVAAICESMLSPASSAMPVISFF